MGWTTVNWCITSFQFLSMNLKNRFSYSLNRINIYMFDSLFGLHRKNKHKNRRNTSTMMRAFWAKLINALRSNGMELFGWTASRFIRKYNLSKMKSGTEREREWNEYFLKKTIYPKPFWTYTMFRRGFCCCFIFCSGKLFAIHSAFNHCLRCNQQIRIFSGVKFRSGHREMCQKDILVRALRKHKSDILMEIIKCLKSHIYHMKCCFFLPFLSHLGRMLQQLKTYSKPSKCSHVSFFTYVGRF